MCSDGKKNPDLALVLVALIGGGRISGGQGGVPLKLRTDTVGRVHFWWWFERKRCGNVEGKGDLRWGWLSEVEGMAKSNKLFSQNRNLQSIR